MGKRERQAHADVRVMLLINADGFWSRGILQGINDVATLHSWTVLRHITDSPLEDYIRDWRPDAIVFSPQSLGRRPPGKLPGIIVGANCDLAGEKIASVVVDEQEVGAMAARHLLSKGLRHFACFRFDSSSFAIGRAEGFVKAVLAGGGTIHRKGFLDDPKVNAESARHEQINRWLTTMPKPIGIMACCDSWARILTCYCKSLGIRIPEDVALIGADNDVVECELTAPPISSIAIPWRRFGREVGELIHEGVKRKRLPPRRVVISPTDVIERRSSDILAVDDEEVAAAVTWIRRNASRPLSVPEVVREIPTYRQKLERRFRAVLGRTINQEIKRAHVDLARRLLAVSTMSMPDIAERSGYSNATLMGIAFRAETGVTPSEYRRRFAAESAESNGNTGE